MTFDKWELKDFLTIDQAVDYLSVKGGQSQDLINPNRVRGVDVLRLALEGRLSLVVDVPTNTEDSEGRSIEAGLWDLPIEQAAKQQIEYDWRLRDGSDSRNTDGIEGAWVERGKDRRQLEPVRDFGSSSAFGLGCILGVRKEALDALLGKKEAATQEAAWSDLTLLMTDGALNAQVRFADAETRNFTYTEMGFEDSRNRGPKKAWFMLEFLAKQNEGAPTCKRYDIPKVELRKQVELRMKEIRNTLREFMNKNYPGYNIPSKSLPTEGHTDKKTKQGYYETTFKIGLPSNSRPLKEISSENP